MRVAPFIVLVLLALTAGCANVRQPPQGRTATASPVGATARPSRSPQPNADQSNVVAAAPAAHPATPPSRSSQPEVTRSDAAASVRAASRASPSATGLTGQSATNSKSSNAQSPASIPAPPAATAQLQKKENITPVIRKAPAVPPLDLVSLEERLKDTNAIGVFTKLSLKNQVNELLDRFRAYHRGNDNTPPNDLRQRYDLLLLKVLSLLQDSDPSLAAAIVASREAIWSILTDPIKFATLALDRQEESWANA